VIYTAETVAVCCSVLLCVNGFILDEAATCDIHGSVLQCVAVRCSVLLCVAVCQWFQLD